MHLVPYWIEWGVTVTMFVYTETKILNKRLNRMKMRHPVACERSHPFGVQKTLNWQKDSGHLSVCVWLSLLMYFKICSVCVSLFLCQSFSAKMSDGESVKKMLRSVLQASKHGVSINNLQSEYHSLCGEAIPLKKLGYPKLEDYLRSIPSVVRLVHHMGEVRGGFIVTWV